MKPLIWAAVAVGSVALCARAAGQPQAPGPDKTQAPEARPGTGTLGHGLGTYLTVEGVKLEQGKVGERTLLIDTINGKRLDKPVAIWVNNLDLPSKKRCVFKGYENGSMIGKPPAVFEAAKELGKEVGVPQAAWQWSSFFVVLIVVEPKGLKPTNDPFMD